MGAIRAGRAAWSGVYEVSLDRLRRNLERVSTRIEVACNKSARDASEVDILAATKYVGVDDLGILAEAGIGLLGENRVQDLMEKQSRWGDVFTWDFIGHLQSRKVKEVLPRVRLIHSICTESVLERIERHAEGGVDLLLEVNLSGEATKSGVRQEDLNDFLKMASSYRRPRFAGLMTMPPISEDPEGSRDYFARLRALAGELNEEWAPGHEFTELSMGTSQDYSVAVEEGATVVRLGVALIS